MLSSIAELIKLPIVTKLVFYIKLLENRQGKIIVVKARGKLQTITQIQDLSLNELQN